MKNTVIKSLFVGAVLVFGMPPTFAQGTIVFDTFNTDTAYGRVFLSNGETPHWDGWYGQIWSSDAGPAGSLSPASPPEFFSATLPGYIQDGTVAFPADSPGTTVWLQLRVWSASAGMSWQAGLNSLNEVGLSEIVPRVLGGVAPDGTVFPTESFNNFPTFATYFIPEPGAFGLLALGSLLLSWRIKKGGAVALLRFRRQGMWER